MVIINVGIFEKMRAAIRAESASPGKPNLSEVHRAEGNGGFKEHVLVLED
ncbi:hypothetical protein X759_15840 [Mesorhizobium sp. LSHC420B00]|nr:hypothetical protein X772_18160 [Mesorhizobium sp. LSJC280B00]ESX77870.1 hypothetical protein X759_15840 [Mesorhizobium sp. LSHC420B00]